MKPSKRYEPRRGIAYRKFKGEMVIVSPHENILLRLNETASLIWEQLESKPVDEIIEAVTDVFDTDIATAERDTKAFVNLLLERELIRPTEAGAG